jgi:hypothetical protein
MINNEIEAVEVLNRRGREIIKEYLQTNSQDLDENFLLSTLT